KKERACRAILSQQPSNQKAQSQQSKEGEADVKSAKFHGPARDLPSRGHIEQREFEGQRQSADLHKIAKPQPPESAVRVSRTQKQRHHGGHNPEKHQEVARPERPGGRVHIVVIVGVTNVADESESDRKGNQAPNPPAKGTGSP